MGYEDSPGVAPRHPRDEPGSPGNNGKEDDHRDKDGADAVREALRRGTRIRY